MALSSFQAWHQHLSGKLPHLSSHGCRSPLFCTPRALAGVGVGTRGTNPRASPSSSRASSSSPKELQSFLTAEDKTGTVGEQRAAQRPPPASCGDFPLGETWCAAFVLDSNFFFHRNISTNLPALQLLGFCTCSRVHGMFALNTWCKK